VTDSSTGSRIRPTRRLSLGGGTRRGNNYTLDGVPIPTSQPAVANLSMKR
jgi:hypothetical protein